MMKQNDFYTKGNTFDIVIYGGTSAGVIAAVQAVKMGKSVVLIEPSSRLGGLSSGGLGDTDFGNNSVIGGISLEFYQRVGAKYGEEKPVWMFEPKVALEVFQDLVKEYDILVYYGERLDLINGVSKAGSQIEYIIMESGKTFKAKIFLDTSYEGDLMAKAGASYATGREANDLYGEIYNGVQTENAVLNNLPSGIDPYVIKGDPSSGLLPHVFLNAGGKDGEGDTKIQAYCYRMCLTDDPTNRIMVEKPSGYNELEYELLFRSIEQGEKDIFKLRMLPNRKTDSNNLQGFSTDYIGQNYDYPEADYKRREQIARAHKTYQKGLVWTVQNHSRVPEELREFYEPWGLPMDEFTDNGHWTPQLYIRESRRMISDMVMNENHIMLKQPVEDPVGLGSYTMDSHNVQRHIDENGFVTNEGDVQIRLEAPYPISYQSMVPKESECSNLLVPVCLSASHIAYGSIRMEPVFMVLAQSAATAAVLALEKGISPQNIDYRQLRETLEGEGQVLGF